MKVGLFIPCYIDQFYPQVGMASYKLLKKFGCEVHYPLKQTCCGQPVANAGMEQMAKPIYQLFIDNFKDYDYIVAPSGSCIYHVKKHFHICPSAEQLAVSKKVYEIGEFLVDILKVNSIDATFSYKVGIHNGCHGLRGLQLGKASELMGVEFSKVKYLLSLVNGIQLINLARKDECCGFGGTFAVNESAVSAKMGKDRIQDHLENQAEVITSADMSCLMHLEGLVKRNKQSVRIIHYTEILNGVE